MEDLLHYIWKFRLYDNQLTTTSGEPIEIIDVGVSNTNEGPDFFNAKVKIGGRIWAGNIEIHESSDQWYAHKHHENENYNSVILHIVKKANKEVISKQGLTIPQCEIKYAKALEENYDFLIHSNATIPCCNYIGEMSAFMMNSWLNNLLVERLERKANHILELLQQYNGSWDDAFYILLSRNFGFGLNSDPFERLAKSLPLSYILKQRDNIVQIEAMLFGQAGMLNESDIKDDYQNLLRKEYLFLSSKFELTPVRNSPFLNMRVRPSSNPQIRIAQLASLLYKFNGLFHQLMTTEDVGAIRLQLHVNASDYWQTHYIFGSVSERKSKYIGDASLDSIIINTIVPLLFTYGRHMGDESMCDRSLRFLEDIKCEGNSIIRDFGRLKVPTRNAADSQAIIQLRKEYCDKKKCLYCRVGYNVLAKK